MPQIKAELNNCSNQEGKNPQTGGGLGGARPVPCPGRAPLQRASPQPGTAATTTPGMHRGTPPPAASALAPRCMPGAVVLEAAGGSLRPAAGNPYSPEPATTSSLRGGVRRPPRLLARSAKGTSSKGRRRKRATGNRGSMARPQPCRRPAQKRAVTPPGVRQPAWLKPPRLARRCAGAVVAAGERARPAVRARAAGAEGPGAVGPCRGTGAGPGREGEGRGGDGGTLPPVLVAGGRLSGTAPLLSVCDACSR